MNNPEKAEAAPEESHETEGAASHAAPKSRQSLAKSRRELTEEEMSQSGVRMMLLDELDRLDGEVVRLNEYREKFYVADKRIAQLDAKHKRTLANEVVHVICVALGIGILMLSPTLTGSLEWWAVAVGLILTVCGIVAKAMQE